MLEWVEVILKPYVADNVPPKIIPIISLDSFSVHLKNSVFHAIQVLGIKVNFIPPGCTGLVQLVNVDFSKPFKSKMLNQDPDKPTPNSTCHIVTGWIITAKCDIQTEMICNAWKKHDFFTSQTNPRNDSK